MNKSALFTAAHKIAKQTFKAVGNYMIAFSLALKSIYEELKMKNKAEIWGDCYEISGTSLAFHTLEEATDEFNKRDAKNLHCEVQIRESKGSSRMKTVLSNHARKLAEYNAEMDALIAEASK